MLLEICSGSLWRPSLAVASMDRPALCWLHRVQGTLDAPSGSAERACVAQKKENDDDDDDDDEGDGVGDDVVDDDDWFPMLPSGQFWPGGGGCGKDPPLWPWPWTHPLALPLAISTT